MNIIILCGFFFFLYCTLLFWKACSVVTIASSAAPWWQGVLGVFLLLSLSSLLWCISLGKWLWWCQLTPSLPPSLRKPDPSSQTPTQTSAHLHIPLTHFLLPPLTTHPTPPTSLPLFFYSTCDVFTSALTCSLLLPFWIFIGASMMMTRGALITCRFWSKIHVGCGF